jgi:glycosyltransferase involved in cell wall biosynthesis
MMSSAQQPSPLVSVIVPAHNAAATLGACLTALAASRSVPHEVIVVDDGSSDATAAIATAHGARIVRLARRSGAAAARNAGARQATAALLFFTDADVLVTPDALARAVATLQDHPELSAVFGSYTETTMHPNFCSVYKNLVHHLTHQAASPEAITFWGAASAIRAAAFWAVGGFDPADTRTADVEDIALGYRLTRAGFRIRLDRDLQVTHAKHYTLAGLIRSDVFHRAVPWTRLMLRERIFRRDLNTGGGSLASALTVLLLGPALLGGVAYPPLYALAVGLLALYLALNRRFLAAFARRGPGFLLRATAMTVLYYLYASGGALLGLLLYVRQPRPRVHPAPAGSAAASIASERGGAS